MTQIKTITISVEEFEKNIANLEYQRRLNKALEDLKQAEKEQRSWLDYTRHASTNIDVHTQPYFIEQTARVLNNYLEKLTIHTNLLKETK